MDGDEEEAVVRFGWTSGDATIFEDTVSSIRR